MELKNIAEELAKIDTDNKAGIKVTLMTGDANISIYAAEIAPNTELNPHYHTVGIETYQILEGSGIMRIGEYLNDTLRWIEAVDVKKGDCFSIHSPQVHQIVNNTNETLLAIFSCPSAHLGDDRYFVK